MSYDAAKSLAYAESQVGFHEVPNGSNNNPWSEWQYGVHAPGGGYCQSFASFCAVAGGFQFGPGATYGNKGFSYTGASMEWAQHNGLWRDKSWRAQPGDWVIFDWNHDGATDHVEVVKYDDGVMILTVGGNTSNAVMYRKRDRAYVVGFVALSQSPQVVPPFDAAALDAVKRLLSWQKRVAKHELEEGDTSNDVAILNQVLAKKGLLILTPTSKVAHYGIWTRRAVASFKRSQKISPAHGGYCAGPAAAALLAPHGS